MAGVGGGPFHASRTLGPHLPWSKPSSPCGLQPAVASHQPTKNSEDQLLDSLTTRSLPPTPRQAPNRSKFLFYRECQICEDFPVSVDTSRCPRGHVCTCKYSEKSSTCPSDCPTKEGAKLTGQGLDWPVAKY